MFLDCSDLLARMIFSGLSNLSWFSCLQTQDKLEPIKCLSTFFRTFLGLKYILLAKSALKCYLRKQTFMAWRVIANSNSPHFNQSPKLFWNSQTFRISPMCLSWLKPKARPCVSFESSSSGDSQPYFTFDVVSLTFFKWLQFVGNSFVDIQKVLLKFVFKKFLCSIWRERLFLFKMSI